MKWNQVIAPRHDSERDDCDSDEEIQKLKQRIRIRRRECMKEVIYTHTQKTPTSRVKIYDLWANLKKIARKRFYDIF